MHSNSVQALRNGISRMHIVCSRRTRLNNIEAESVCIVRIEMKWNHTWNFYFCHSLFMFCFSFASSKMDNDNDDELKWNVCALCVTHIHCHRRRPHTSHIECCFFVREAILKFRVRIFSILFSLSYARNPNHTVQSHIKVFSSLSFSWSTLRLQCSRLELRGTFSTFLCVQKCLYRKTTQLHSIATVLSWKENVVNGIVDS